MVTEDSLFGFQGAGPFEEEGLRRAVLSERARLYEGVLAKEAGGSTWLTRWVAVVRHESFLCILPFSKESMRL